MITGSEEAVSPQYGLEFCDRSATVHGRNRISEEVKAVSDQFVNGLRIPAGGVKVNNDPVRQFDRFGATQDDIPHGPPPALCEKAPVPRLRAIDEAPIQESRVARGNHGVISSRSLPELVDLGAEAINLDDARGPGRRSDRFLKSRSRRSGLATRGKSRWN